MEHSKKIEKQENELSKIEKEVKSLKKQTEKLFSKLNISEKDIESYLDKNNFSKEEWKQMQRERKKLENALEQETENVDHPSRKEKAFKDLKNIGPWGVRI